MLAFVRRNCSCFSDPYTYKTLYTAFVRSRLEYAAFIWRPYHATYVNRIERIQKSFIRFALSSMKFTEPIPSYLSRCMLLDLKSLASRRAFLSGSFVANILGGYVDCPELLSRIGFNVPSRSLRHVDIFFIPFVKSYYSLNAPLIRTLIELNQCYSLDISLPRGLVTLCLSNHFK